MLFNSRKGNNMAEKLTEHQLMIIQGMVQYAEAMANQLFHIMENHGLDKVEGFRIRIDVNPEYEMVTKGVRIGYRTNLENGLPGGFCDLVSGRKEEKYAPIGKNSPEYELLFADEAVRKAMEKVLHREKPLPPDGLWIGDSRNSDPVGNWEWDVNDSLS